METRIVIPGAMASAVILAIAFSALVPTRMVGPKPPPWQDVVHADRRTDPGPTYAFYPTPPTDLDPAMPVGPQPAAPGEQRGLADATAFREAPRNSVYIAVNYDAPDETVASNAGDRGPATLPTQFQGLY